MKPKHLTRNNVILMLCLLALLFIFPMFTTRGALVRDIVQTAIFFSGIFSLDFSEKSLKILLPLGTITAATTWIHHVVRHETTFLIDFVTTFLFLVAIVVLLIRHIARSREVTPTIILSAINGYLLLGVLGGVLLAIGESVERIILATDVAAIAFPGNHAPQLFDYLYFSFVTLTTLGYGDVTPVSHMARAMAILIALTGQMYMTILIAMLVGKFLSRAEGK